MSNRKVFKRNYRFLLQDAEIAEKQIMEMLDAGVFEPSTCADVKGRFSWSIKKTVQNVRQLNLIVAPKLIQLPKINELLDEVSSMKCKYLSTADLRSGFFQIALAENS